MSGVLPAIKDAVWRRDDWQCCYCGIKVIRAGLDQPDDAPDTATVDHVTPRSAGGSHAMKNLVTCCRRCNNRKGDGPVDGAPYSPTLADVWPVEHD